MSARELDEAVRPDSFGGAEGRRFHHVSAEKEAKLMTCERRNGMPGESEMDDANFCVPSTWKSRVHVCDGKLVAKQVIGRHCALEMLVILGDVLCIQSIIRLKVLFINIVAPGLHFRSYFHHFSVSTNQPDHPPHHLSTNSW